jgi:hypothetical protein
MSCVHLPTWRRQVVRAAETPLELLCAIVNNNSRMMETSAEMGEQAEEWLPEALWSRLDLDRAVAGRVAPARRRRRVLAPPGVPAPGV